ncbi:uncharacterized protein LOC101460243 [Ceratitis capitata]|uniref:uncharacterized protein LOC101460243 n=1 Tax=Ceratitis capitata TaxID=7213 RepID=UPI000A100C24|nr:uncharacterized protein LOC101460243 [Ceratitis capitata]
MALSLSSPQAAQQMPSSTVWTRQSQPQERSMYATSVAVTPQNQQHKSAPLRLQKQNSFTEANRTQYIAGGNANLLAARRAGSGYLTRGLSVDRSLENIRKKVHTQSSTAVGAHEAQSKRIITRKSAKSGGGEKLKGIKTSTFADGKHSYMRANSTSSLLKTLDHELKQVNGQLVQRFNYNSVCVPASVEEQTGLESFSSKSNTLLPSSEQEDKIKNSSPALKKDSSKVNLNIVLSHAINYIPINGNESNNSDIESSSENAEPYRKSKSTTTRILRTDLPARTNVSATAAATAATSTTITANDTVQQRRAQFRSSRNVTINTNTSQSNTSQLSVPSVNNATLAINNQQPTATAVTSLTSNCSGGTLNVTPSLIVQRRPPLVRAMSAPVRSRSLDENSKGVFAFQKRKLRRRKLITRNASVCEKSEPAASEFGGSGRGGGAADRSDLLYDSNGFSGKKQPLTRTRSTLAVDVITLVSLVSSEGSDSEKEDSAPETGRGNAERSRSTGAPFLRKTGKSVSFQENYPPNFQLATKEYSHMIRRGSVAPLAARLRSNRPPTAPPVSIFMNEANTNSSMATNAIENVASRENGGSDSNSNIVSDSTQNTTKTSTEHTLNDKENEEYIYPEYVRSLKERECWKLYRKMSVKGVSVTYETVLRGMLTPTEFRQIQKQREIEEAKARALEEEKDGALEQHTPTSAVDRLTQKLLKK